MIEFQDIYIPITENKIGVLYELLVEREPWQSISHKKMPTYQEHRNFVLSYPYSHWYLVNYNDMAVGAIYLSKRREIGIHIFKTFQGMGYGKAAVQKLMEMHPGKFLWNTNPNNAPSIKLVESLGGKLIQWTFEIDG